jgi:hypothetical protein
MRLNVPPWARADIEEAAGICRGGLLASAARGL